MTFQVERTKLKLCCLELVGLETDIAFNLQKLSGEQRVLKNVSKVFSFLEFIKIHPKNPLKLAFKFVFIISMRFFFK